MDTARSWLSICWQQITHKRRKKKFHVLEKVDKDSKDWPDPRSGHRMCADENYLYVFGGYDPAKNNRLYNELWRYNISTEKWIKLPDVQKRAPLECTSSAMLMWRRKIIIFGGSGYPFARTNSSKLYVYCLETFQWIDLNEKRNEKTINVNKCSPFIDLTCSCKETDCAEPPVGKYGHTMSLFESTGELFIFSGTTGRLFSDELHKFSLIDLTWNLIEHCPEHGEEKPCGRFRHEVVWDNNEFFIFGGETLKESTEMNYVYSFDFERYKWNKHLCYSDETFKKENGEMNSAFPCARKAHSCVRYDGRVYMVGGISGKTHLDDIWIFCLATKTWSKSDKLTFPRKIHFHAATVTKQGCMYVFGGIDEDNNRRNELHKMWLCAPSLKEQSWMKIAKLLKKYNRLRKEVLVELGIPKEFYHRVDDVCIAAA